MAYAIYLKCDDLKGSCAAKGYEDTIELISVNHSISLPVSFSQSREGGLSAGIPQHDPLTIEYELCSATPKLSELMNGGKHVKEVAILFSKKGGDSNVDFYKITLNDVVFSSHDFKADTRSEAMAPTLEADLTYNKIQLEHTVMDNTGSGAGKTASTYSVTQVAKG